MTHEQIIAELVRIWHSPHLDLILKARLGEVIEALKADTVQGAYLINKHDAITVIRDQCWKCNNVINDDLCMRILALPDSEQTDCTEFIEWLIEVIMDDDDWELNSAAYGEIIARKMKKLGLLEVKDGYYIRPSAEAVEVVRCKECRHSRIEGDTTMFMWCGYWNKPTDGIRYCSDGERREP